MPVSILFADSREYAGAIYGQTLLELPEDGPALEKVTAWLENRKINFRKEA